MDEDEAIRPRKRWLEPLPLDPFSVADLAEYVAALRAEITRVEAASQAKQSHRSAIEAFFRTPT